MTLHETIEKVQLYAKDHPLAIIFLVGDLGAGKTHFTNEFAKSIDVPQRLPSPTFTFLQEYRCDWEHLKKIIHCDLYRIDVDQAEKTLEQIGFWDYVDEGNIIFIEWPERGGEHLQQLPHATITITLADNERTYEFTE